MKITVKIMLFLCLFGMISVQTFGAKKHKVYQKPVYMIGVAMSLTDSVVFITDMHLVDSVTVEKKTKFLKDRQLYSFQLQRYLEATYKGGPYVPAVFFGPKRKTMERHYLSLHKRYVQSKEFRMVLVDQSQFRFKSEKYIEEITE
ncbi:MAG: hypothetical protein IJ020_04845 [Bacteroidaceae bacterium]|nr:hypothetical protein [Bacteroidaceae bacterium]